MNTEATQDYQERNTAGARLRYAREQLGLSQKTVAERLCLKVSTVRDIEEDKAQAELAPTFLRGYIRSYARLVHIPEDELLPMMEKQPPVRMAKMTSVQGAALGKQRKKRDGWLMSITWLVFFVVVGLSGIWWWQEHKAQQEEISTLVGQPVATELNIDNSSQHAQSDSDERAPKDAEIADNANKVVTTPPSGPASSPEQRVATPSVVAPPQTKADTVPTATTATAAPLPVTPAGATQDLVLNFSAACWLEVSDATGKKLFSGLQSKGSNLSLHGEAPYKLTIGAPAAVQIEYRGKPVDLSRFIKTHQVARLTLNAESSPAQ